MLFPKFRLPFAVLCCLVCSGSAFAQNQHLVGRKVMTIKWDTEFKEGNRVTFKSDLGKVYEVEKVNGQWLWLAGRGRRGWVKSSDIVPYEQAIDHFNRLVRRDGSSTNYYLRALAWKAKGELDIALGDFNKAIRRGRTANLYNARGSVWDDRGDYDRAIADYNEAIRLDPKYADAYNNLAWLLSTCPDAKYRNGKKAIKHATKACELSSWKNASRIDTLAAAYAETGEFDKAVQWSTKAIGMVSESENPLDQEGLDLYRAGKPQRQ